MHKLRFSANLGFLWSDRSLVEAIGAAATAGFDAVELHWPYETDATQVRAALRGSGMPVLALNTPRGNAAAGEFGLAALPGREVDARAAIDQAFAYGTEIGARAVHVMAGKTQGRAAEETLLANLVHASDRGRAAGMDVLIEPINAYDVPGYFLSDPEMAAHIIRSSGRDNIRMLFDCYHLARMNLDLTGALKRYLPLVGHVQFAAVPDRGEPDRGEVDYAALLPAIQRAGYSGLFGAEYRPRGLTTQQGLAWLHRFRVDR